MLHDVSLPFELSVMIPIPPSLPSSVPSLPSNVEGALESQGLPSSVPSLPPDEDDVPSMQAFREGSLEPQALLRSPGPASCSEVHNAFREGAVESDDMDLEMPAEVPGESDDDCPNAFDDLADSDLEDLDIESDMLHILDHGSATGVPSPSVAVQLSTPQDIAELYSPPRVLPVARGFGQRGCLSLDIMTGWDFNSEADRMLSRRLLVKLDVKHVILSPPCTAFSELQRLWNYKRMTPEAIQQQWTQGMVHLNHSMDCAMDQLSRNACFGFERPARASSWRQPEVQRVLSQPGVVVVSFDQCMLGLKSKVHGIPMRKRTKIATNSRALAARFAMPCCRCDRSHVHQTIQGSEGGLRRSVWAQMYPPGMVDLLARPI